MAELKTKPTGASVTDFLNAVPDERRRQDCLKVDELMRAATGAEPKMWGTSIVGYGDYRYRYATGREGDWFVTGFSPRKANLTIYLIGGTQPYPELMAKLGKHKTGMGCLYVNKLQDIDLPTLQALIEKTVQQAKP